MNKSYVAFVGKDGKYEIMFFSGVNRENFENNMRANGYNVYLTLTPETVEKYRSNPPCEFYEKYEKRFPEDLCRTTDKFLFGI